MDAQGQAHIRPTKKTRNRLSKVANAATTIQGFDHDLDIVGLTYGQFSLIDLIEATLGIVGPAHVVISTWSAGFYDAEAANRFASDGRMLSCRFIMDSSAKRGQATPAGIAEIFGQDSIRTTRSHAKFVLIRNDEWNVVITSSMNLNLNPRVEQFEMTDDAERYALFDQFVQSVWNDLPEGWIEDRRLPPAHGMEHVQEQMPVAVGPVKDRPWMR